MSNSQNFDDVDDMIFLIWSSVTGWNWLKLHETGCDGSNIGMFCNESRIVVILLMEQLANSSAGSQSVFASGTELSVFLPVILLKSLYNCLVFPLHSRTSSFLRPGTSNLFSSFSTFLFTHSHLLQFHLICKPHVVVLNNNCLGLLWCLAVSCFLCSFFKFADQLMNIRHVPKVSLEVLYQYITIYMLPYIRYVTVFCTMFSLGISIVLWIMQ